MFEKPGRIVLVMIAAIFLAGCAKATPEPVSFTLNMKEYAFEPAQIEVQVGQQVTLELVNSGVLPHEVMFGRNVMKDNNRPHGYEIDMFETAHVQPTLTHPDGSMMEASHEEGHEGFMVVLEKTGDQAVMNFEVTKDMVGEWEMGCFEQDGVHYDAGMIGTFTVIP